MTIGLGKEAGKMQFLSRHSSMTIRKLSIVDEPCRKKAGISSTAKRRRKAKSQRSEIESKENKRQTPSANKTRQNISSKCKQSTAKTRSEKGIE